MNVRTLSSLLLAFTVVAIPSMVAAQQPQGGGGGGGWNPEGGDTGQWQPPPQQQQQQQPQQQQQQPAQQNAWGQSGGQEHPPAMGGGDTGNNNQNQTDHAMVVGHLGVGFFGVRGVTMSPGMDGAFGTGDDLVVPAPTVGVRFWLNDTIGLDAALGIGFVKQSFNVDTPMATDSGDIFSGFAMALHGGLPIALLKGEHYAFELIPEINLGFGNATQFGATPNDDQQFSGFSLDVGARVGGEIQFGFIDIPHLSLQGSVGADLNYTSVSLENDFGNPAGSTITTTSGFSLQTTTQNNPWNIFIADISAIYYF